MYLRNLAAISAAGLGELAGSRLIVQRGEPLLDVAALDQRQHHEDENEDGKSDRIVDASGDGLNEPHPPHHVEPLGKRPDDQNVMLFEPVRPLGIELLEARARD